MWGGSVRSQAHLPTRPYTPTLLFRPPALHSPHALLRPPPPWTFLALALAGILAGFGLRVLLREAAWRRDGHKQTRQERFEFLVGTLSQSAAIGLALTLVGGFAVGVADERCAAAGRADGADRGRDRLLRRRSCGR